MLTRNRRRGMNTVRVSYVARWLAAVAFLGIVGLSFVYMRNKLHQYGEQRRLLEKRLAALRQESQVVQVQITEWGSRAVLHRRLQEGFVRLVPIPDGRVVRLQVPPGKPAGGELRPVALAGGEGR